MTLTEFLLARIAEDEATARKAGLDDPHWRYNTERWGGAQIESSDGTNITHDMEGLSDSVQDFAGPHIARHDPARVLAECEAKRRIVARHSLHPHYPVCEWCYVSEPEFQAAPYPCVELRDLATVYADHPDYDEAWRA